MNNDICPKSLSGKHRFVSHRADIFELPFFPSAWKRSDNTIYACAYCGIIDDQKGFPNE